MGHRWKSSDVTPLVMDNLITKYYLISFMFLHSNSLNWASLPLFLSGTKCRKSFSSKMSRQCKFMWLDPPFLIFKVVGRGGQLAQLSLSYIFVMTMSSSNVFFTCFSESQHEVFVDFAYRAGNFSENVSDYYSSISLSAQYKIGNATDSIRTSTIAIKYKVLNYFNRT